MVTLICKDGQGQAGSFTADIKISLITSSLKNWEELLLPQ